MIFFSDDSALHKKRSINSNIKTLSLSRLFPNIVTLMALCSGMSAIRCALNQRWELAVTFILIAAFLDGIDGRLARLLKATSSFGAQLDSLSDFLSFGIAPALVLYLWALHNISIKGLGWAICLFFSMCCAIRLARFNTSINDEERPAWNDKFFVGVSAPAGACLSLIPMLLNFQYSELTINSNPLLIGCYSLVIASLMASRIPTFSGKKVIIKSELVSFILILAGIIITSLLLEPWLTLTILGICYILSIPFSIWNFYQIKKDLLN